MRKIRCKPNQVCIIIGEVPGHECNIGALITTVKLFQEYTLDATWTFRDASRPLLTQIGTATGSFDFPDEIFLIYDHHLMPIDPGEDLLEIEREALKELSKVD